MRGPTLRALSGLLCATLLIAGCGTTDDGGVVEELEGELADLRATVEQLELEVADLRAELGEQADAEPAGDRVVAEFSGEWSETLDETFVVEPGWRLEWDIEDPNGFQVRLLTGSGAPIGWLPSPGLHTGARTVNEGGELSLEVRARGDWELRVVQPGG